MKLPHAFIHSKSPDRDCAWPGDLVCYPPRVRSAETVTTGEETTNVDALFLPDSPDSLKVIVTPGN
jgi:hypothetical protein